MKKKSEIKPPLVFALVKFMFSKKATKINTIPTVHLTLHNVNVDGEEVFLFQNVLYFEITFYFKVYFSYKKEETHGVKMYAI